MKTQEELGISPAPWFVQGFSEGESIVDADRAWVIDDDGTIRNEADRRLIAAAPELYEALWFINEHIAFTPLGGGADVVDEAKRKMIAALARAGGEEEK